MGLKANRGLAMTEQDKENSNYQRLESIGLEDGIAKQVYLKDVDFPVQVLKQTYDNKDGSIGVVYLVTNDLSIDGDKNPRDLQKTVEN